MNKIDHRLLHVTCTSRQLQLHNSLIHVCGDTVCTLHTHTHSHTHTHTYTHSLTHVHIHTHCALHECEECILQAEVGRGLYYRLWLGFQFLDLNARLSKALISSITCFRWGPPLHALLGLMMHCSGNVGMLKELSRFEILVQILCGESFILAMSILWSI